LYFVPYRDQKLSKLSFVTFRAPLATSETPTGSAVHSFCLWVSSVESYQHPVFRRCGQNRRQRLDVTLSGGCAKPGSSESRTGQQQRRRPAAVPVGLVHVGTITVAIA
jgi:hypothetical protein